MESLNIINFKMRKAGLSMSTFNGLEVIKTAILMEEEGIDFYTQSAKLSEGKIKDFLLIAAGQEFAHRDKFQTIYDELLSKSDIDFNYLFDDETNGYLKILIENQVFKKDKPKEYINLLEVLEEAVRSEKHTIELYSRMYSGVRLPEVKAVIEKIMEEEKHHAEYFEILAKELAWGGSH